MKDSGNNYRKPKNKTAEDLYTVEIWLEDVRQYRLIRDCKYNERNKQFIQIDDLSIFDLNEIYEWTRQN